MKNRFIVQQETVENGYNDGMELTFKEVFFVQYLDSTGARYNHFKRFDDVRDANALFIKIHTAIACGKLVHFNDTALWAETIPVYGSPRHIELGDEVFA
jgi:hypothetical protein